MGVAVRAGLVTLGLLIGLVTLEVGMRLAGPFLRPGPRQTRSQTASGGALRVLCVGDSHTYGIWVKPNESYPARLQDKLARLPGRFEVLNAGVPGMNSSQVRQALPALLENFAPDVVLVMVGVADFWNLTALQTDELSGWRWLLRGGGWWDRSRVVKLARLIRFNLKYGRTAVAPAAPVIEHTPYNWKIKGGDLNLNVDIDEHIDDPIRDARLVRRILRRDLAAIVATAEAQGSVVVLMTYATDSSLYAVVNEAYRTFAANTGLPLIDLAERLRRWSRPPGEKVAFFPDYHPRRAGYELMARAIAGVLPEYVSLSTPHASESRRPFSS